MAEKRIVGIDFGTSTSVVRAKNYTVNGSGADEQWQPSDKDVTAARSVTFNNGAVLVPTLVQKLSDGSTYFGYDAAESRNGAVTYQNFKVELNGENSQEARALTQEYIGFLYKNYNDQRDGGHMGDVNAEEKTIISYPVKWDKETREFMISAAEKAGFKNVEGMDEAQAAIIAVTAISRDMLEKKQYISAGKPVNIMLIDMGAGTTDIVICRYTHGEKPKNDILCTWPKGGDILFGGRELDVILKSYIMGKVPEEYRAVLSNFVSDMEYKSWKENNVSDSLGKNESVTTFNRIDSILYQFYQSGLEPFTLDRKEFEGYAEEYLAKFAEMVNGSISHCVKDGTLTGGNDIDLVILTGGHSQWYFVREMLSGRKIAGKTISLGKIEADQGRIIDISKPHETVALGLVYSKLEVEIKNEDEDDTQHTDQTSSQPQTEPETESETQMASQTTELICPTCNNRALGNNTDTCAFCGLPMNRDHKEAWDEFQKVLSDFFSNITTDRPSNNILRFIRKLDISENETVYYYNDSSWFKRGASGVAVVTNGIYYRILLERDTIYWHQFLTNEIIIDDGYCIRIKSDDLPEYNRLGTVPEFEMYTKLQSELRKTKYYKLLTEKE